MNNRRTVRLCSVAAAALWVLAVAATLAGTTMLVFGYLYVALGFYAHDMLLIGAAAVFTMRACLDSHTRAILNHLEIGSEVGGLRRISR